MTRLRPCRTISHIRPSTSPPRIARVKNCEHDARHGLDSSLVRRDQDGRGGRLLSGRRRRSAAVRAERRRRAHRGVSPFRARVLGSGAGGGLPQWNCGCSNCTLVRAADPRLSPRTQDSLAFSASDEWLLVNTSPDVLRQIEAFPALHPRAPRDSPVAGVVLTNGDLDHVTGLLSLRESQPLVLFATERVRAGLVERNAMLRTLSRFEGHVAWKRLELGREVVLERAGLGVTALPAPGK